jgi:hypothetical protein
VHDSVEHHLGEVNFYLDNAEPSFLRGKGAGFNWINNAFISERANKSKSIMAERSGDDVSTLPTA